jgi:hypothetical protein
VKPSHHRVAPAKAGAPCRSLCILAALASSILCRDLQAQRDPLPADSVVVDVRVHAESALVNARYFLARPVRAMDLTYLTNTCAAVSAIAATRSGTAVAFSIDTTLPWVTLHDTTDTANEGQGPLRYEVAYRVHLGFAKRVAIPLVQPARALDARTASVRPKVRVDLRTAGVGIGEPEFPRFDRVDASQWTSTNIAVPSTVVVRGALRPGQTPCDVAVRSAGSNDGFTWRFTAFVGTLVLWIPLYFAWATRRRRSDDDAEAST